MFNHWAFRWSIVTSGGLEMTIGFRDLHDNLELISDEKLPGWALSPHWVWLYPHTPADLVYFITFLLFLFLLLCVVLASNVSLKGPVTGVSDSGSQNACTLVPDSRLQQKSNEVNQNSYCYWNYLSSKRCKIGTWCKDRYHLLSIWTLSFYIFLTPVVGI